MSRLDDDYLWDKSGMPDPGGPGQDWIDGDQDGFHGGAQAGIPLTLSVQELLAFGFGKLEHPIAQPEQPP